MLALRLVTVQWCSFLFRLFLKSLCWRERKEANKHKWEEKKSRSEKKVSKKQLIEESDDDDEVISNVGGNNSSDDLSEPNDEMEAGSINDNFRNTFYFAVRINLHTFLAEQVSYFSGSHPVSIKNLSYKPQVIVTKHSLLDLFKS